MTQEIRTRRAERGVVLVLTAVLALVMITMIAFAIELGRIIITARNLQAAADGAALAGVQRLKKCYGFLQETTPLDFECTAYSGGRPSGLPFPLPSVLPPDSYNIYPGGPASAVGGWKAVKPAVVEVLANLPVPGVIIPRVTWGSGAGTFCDEPFVAGSPIANAYGDLTYEEGETLAGDGEFIVRTERMFECVDADGAFQMISVEQSENPGLPKSNYNYCVANAVRVTLNYTGLKLLFANLFRAAPTLSLTRVAVARIRPSNPTYSCQYLPCGLIRDTTQGAPNRIPEDVLPTFVCKYNCP